MSGVFLMTAKTASVNNEPNLSLEQQENLQIKGSKARNIVMQKLLRKSEVKLRGNYTSFRTEL